MILNHFAVYDKATGAVVFTGYAPDRTYALQEDQQATLAIFWLPPGSVTGVNTVSLAIVRSVLVEKIDAEAEAARAGHLTAGEGQAMTYLYKADEARRWTADHTVATPFLTAEAAARGMTIDDLAAEVLGAIALWTHFGAKIEAARMGAKVAVATASNLAELDAAGRVDWQAVLTA